MTWMGIIGNYEVQGKLKCSCGQKLGSFHWAGMQCSCGAWVTPAFAVGKSKVDAVGNQTLAVAAAPRAAGQVAPSTPTTLARNEPAALKQLDDPSQPGHSTEATQHQEQQGQQDLQPQPQPQEQPPQQPHQGEQAKDEEQQPKAEERPSDKQGQPEEQEM